MTKIRIIKKKTPKNRDKKFITNAQVKKPKLIRVSFFFNLFWKLRPRPKKKCVHSWNFVYKKSRNIRQTFFWHKLNTKLNFFLNKYKNLMNFDEWEILKTANFGSAYSEVRRLISDSKFVDDLPTIPRGYFPSRQPHVKCDQDLEGAFGSGKAHFSPTHSNSEKILIRVQKYLSVWVKCSLLVHFFFFFGARRGHRKGKDEWWGKDEGFKTSSSSNCRLLHRTDHFLHDSFIFFILVTSFYLFYFSFESCFSQPPPWTSLHRLSSFWYSAKDWFWPSRAVMPIKDLRPFQRGACHFFLNFGK